MLNYVKLLIETSMYSQQHKYIVKIQKYIIYILYCKKKKYRKESHKMDVVKNRNYIKN